MIHSGLRQNLHQRTVLQQPTQAPIANNDQIYASNQLQMQSSARGTRNQFNQLIPPLQPSVQINIQSLIKPMQQTEKLTNPPIVYSFGQSELTNNFLSNKSNHQSNKSLGNKKITWGLDDTIDYKEDDFSDILG